MFPPSLERIYRAVWKHRHTDRQPKGFWNLKFNAENCLLTFGQNTKNLPQLRKWLLTLSRRLPSGFFCKVICNIHFLCMFIWNCQKYTFNSQFISEKVFSMILYLTKLMMRNERCILSSITLSKYKSIFCILQSNWCVFSSILGSFSEIQLESECRHILNYLQKSVWRVLSPKNCRPVCSIDTEAHRSRHSIGRVVWLHIVWGTRLKCLTRSAIIYFGFCYQIYIDIDCVDSEHACLYTHARTHARTHAVSVYLYDTGY
jgi:hypothetical protein